MDPIAFHLVNSKFSSMKKLIAGVLLFVVVASVGHSMFGELFYETGTMTERSDFQGSSVEYLLYRYWTPVIKEKCEYDIDGSCSRHDSRSECTSVWNECTSTEKKAVGGTIVFNFLLVGIAGLLLGYNPFE